MQLSGLTSLGKWLMQKMNGGGEDSGMYSDCCTLEQAMSYAPVWHCVSKITGAFKIMPLNVLQYQARKRTKTIKENHPAYDLLRWSPNYFQVPSSFKSMMMVHALMLGNARAYIKRVGNKQDGSPIELIPLAPDRTVTAIVAGKKIHAAIIYPNDPIEKYYPVAEKENERRHFFDDEEVLHIPGLGYDGINGYSLLKLASRSWSIGVGAEKQARKYQRKGYTGGMMLEVPESSPMFRTDADAKEFLESFRKQHEGNDPEKSSIGMLRGGIKANAINMSNQDAQFLEQRKFQREDAALQFCLEGILGDSSNASYNSLEQRNLAYRQNCLAPWTVSWEEECEMKLLTSAERRRGFYIKFNDGALLRTDKQTTATIGSQLITARVMNPNEVREWFDMNPYEGGDTYSNPAIEPTTSEEPKEEEKDEMEDQVEDSEDAMEPSSSVNDLAALAMISNLLSVEQKRVIDACKAKNFLDRINSFYLGWEVKLADSIEKIGGDRNLASTHCLESKRRLLEASECLPEQLMESIAKCVESWQNRAQSLLERLS